MTLDSAENMKKQGVSVQSIIAVMKENLSYWHEHRRK